MAYMTAEEAAEWGKTLSFEKVWAALMEDRANIDRLFQKAEEDRKRAEEDRKRADEDRRKSEEAFNRRMAKLDREIEKTTKNINGLSDSVGQFMENMVASNLWTKFDELGYAFTSSHEWQFMLGKRILAEADIFLESDTYAMAVEVKTKLRDSDIDEHIECMEKIREYMQAHGDKRKLIGAVAGGIVSKSALRYAQKKGFYVITQSGSAVEIAKAPENFQPKIW